MLKELSMSIHHNVIKFSQWNNNHLIYLFDDIQISMFNVFISCVYVLYNSAVIGIGLILLFIALLLYYHCVIRDNKLFWIWIWTEFEYI